jgi:hypothetical protein
MFKNLIKGVKNILKSPVGQIGTALLLPGLAGVQSVGTLGNIARGIGSFAAAQPMLTQAGIGLLAGDKPANVLRNVAYGTAARGIGAMMQPGGTFMGGVRESFGMTPSSMSNVPVPQQGGTFSIEGGGSLPGIETQELVTRAKEPGFLERTGLIKSSRIITNPDGSQSIVPVTDFFEKYSPLLKLGVVGASIASAAMTPEEEELFYDPTKNPYLKSGSADKDFYEDINPYYAATMNQGGVMDFPEKDGMINGPGNGQSDDIPAMLSDGEFVFTKQAVMAAGNGDRKQGTKKMYEMMYSLEDKAENMGIGRI